MPTISLPEYRSAVNSTVVPLIIDAPDPEAFRGTVRRVDVGRTTFVRIAASAHTVRRTAELIAGPSEAYIKLSQVIEGQGELRQDGRSVRFAEGDIVIYDTTRPYDLDFNSDSTLLVVMVPKDDFALSEQVLANLTAINLTAGFAVSSAVSAFLSELARNFDQLSTRAGKQLAEMVVAMIRPVLMAAAEDSGFGLDARGRMLRDIEHYIDSNLDDPELSPTSIAKAHYISLRYLHSLFSDHSTTIAATIKARRLDQARAMLRDQSCASMPIAAVASACGMVDAAHFSRAFKERFGVSPTQARRNAGVA